MKKKNISENNEENQKFIEPISGTTNITVANVHLSADGNNSTRNKSKKSPVTRKSPRNTDINETRIAKDGDNCVNVVQKKTRPNK